MSYTTVYLISTTGELREIAEWRNSHGFAPFIWSALCKRYLGDEMAWFNAKKVEKLWTLSGEKTVPREWRAALLCTYDRAVIEHARFIEMATLLNGFMGSPGVANDSRVCHVGSIAWLLEQHAKDVDVSGMCFYVTSTSNNLWFEYDGETDESVPYDFKTGTKHFYVGAALDEVDGVLCKCVVMDGKVGLPVILTCPE